MSQIVIGNALGKYSLRSLKTGIKLGKALNLKVHVIHTDKLADFETLDTIFAHLNLDIQQNYVQSISAANQDSLEKQIRELDLETDHVTCSSLAGSADDIIVQESENSETELIIVGHDKNKSLAERFLGGVTEGIIHKSSKSVLIAKSEAVAAPKKILLAYDFSYHCDEALVWCRKLTDVFNCSLDIINVVPCYYEGYHVAHTIHDGINVAFEEMMDESIDKIKERLNETCRNFTNGSVQTHVLVDKEGSISDKINQYATDNDYDLIVLGSHKRGKISELILGSICSKVLKNSSTSVLIAKG